MKQPIKKGFILIMVLFLSNLVVAVNVTEDVVFYDGVYNYTVNTNFSEPTIQISNEELYFDNVSYCQWDGKLDLTTLRQCVFQFILNVFTHGEDWAKLNYSQFEE